MTLAVWIDGRVLEDPGQPVLGVEDRGFLLGDLVFETIRVASGRPRYWQRHVDRLCAACEVLRLQRVRLPTREEVTSLVGSVSEQGGVLRLTVTRGAGGRGLSPTGGAEPTVVASYSAPPPARPAEGIPTFLAQPWWDRRSPVAGLKTGDRAGAIVQARAGAEGLVTDGAELRCGLASNVFVLIGDVLATPPATEGVRAGVTREVVLTELAPELGLATEERTLTLADLAKASELLFTNATRGVQAATHVEGKDRHFEARIGARLQAAWLARD